MPACASIVRLPRREAIAKEGIVCKNRFGEVREHPACNTERQAMQVFRQTVREMGLDVEPASVTRGPFTAWNTKELIMPIVRRIAAFRALSLETLSKLQRDWFACAANWFNDTDLASDIDASRAAWELHRDTLLPEFIKANPGRRPFAWWIFDHKQERPIREGHGFAEQFFAEQRAETFGYLHTDIWRGPQFVQEPQVAYLRRHNLLSPEELALCPASSDESF